MDAMYGTPTRRVWDPNQTSRIQSLESVQNKGARYVMQDWHRHISVSQMKLSLGWCTLQERRLVNRLVFPQVCAQVS